MAVNFALIGATPNRILYLATRAAGGLQSAIISNQGALSPDIQTDLLAAAVAANQIAADFLSLLTTAVANDAAAQAILIQGTVLKTSLTPVNRNTQSTFWSCDGRADGVSGNPTLIVAYDDNGAGGVGDACVVEIAFIHSMVR